MARIRHRNGSVIDREWIVRLQEAQAHYWHAVERHQQTVEHLDQAVGERSDGSVASAHRAMGLALNELARYQKTLLNLVLDQENPPSDEEDKR